MIKIFPYDILLAWHEKNGRHDLPWRDFEWKDEKRRGYEVWLSEILLQQTQAERGCDYFKRIVAAFPTVESLAATSYETFFGYYKGLGYYSRARNMLAAAKIVSEKHGGIFPKDSESLRALPGVGPYTAEAIRAFAYEIPTLSFDTNLEKVFARYYHGSRFLKLSKTEKSEILENFQRTGLPARIVNGALMDFASLVSNNRKGLVDFDGYPFPDCEFYKTSGALEIEEEKVKAYFPTKDAQIVVILHDSHRHYYSRDTAAYQPFILPASEDDTRHFVQEYFEKAYGLELSVRPAHVKEYRDGKPFVFVNAQVQRGKHDFVAFGKAEKEAGLAGL